MLLSFDRLGFWSAGSFVAENLSGSGHLKCLVCSVCTLTIDFTCYLVHLIKCNFWALVGSSGWKLIRYSFRLTSVYIEESSHPAWADVFRSLRVTILLLRSKLMIIWTGLLIFLDHFIQGMIFSQVSCNFRTNLFIVSYTCCKKTTLIKFPWNGLPFTWNLH